MVVATPDHWHCLATIWACQAKKDVFVAAPWSHDIWEGRRAVDAARQGQRVVAADLACRSREYVDTAKKRSKKANWAKSTSAASRAAGQSNFPDLADTTPPAGLDWNAWNGPAPEAAYNANLQNNWHGYWRYSGGNAAVERHPPARPGPLSLRRDYPKSVCSQGHAVRYGRGQRNARYAW